MFVPELFSSGFVVLSGRSGRSLQARSVETRLAVSLDSNPKGLPSATTSWAQPLSLGEVDRLKDKPLLDMLNALLEQNDERVTLNRVAGEVLVHFAGDHHQANRFEKLVPAQVLKGRFTDTVKLDLAALKQE